MRYYKVQKLECTRKPIKTKHNKNGGKMNGMGTGKKIFHISSPETVGNSKHSGANTKGTVL